MGEPVNRKFFAIVGVGRSGTSLIMSMMNAHPDIVLTPETHFIGQYVVSHPLITASDLKEKLVDDYRFQRLGISYETVDKIIATLRGEFSVAGFYKSILEYYASQKDVLIIGDKAPKNIEYLPTIRYLFPDTYIIHIIRDPRDVYLSRTQAKWSSIYSDTAHYVAYRSQYELGCHLGSKYFGDRYYEIHYEDLLSDPGFELRSICNWLGVSFDAGMLNYSRSARELMSPEEEDWKKETLEPLIKDNKNKWKVELRPEKVWVIEAACSPTFLDGYYERSTTPNRINIMIYQLLISVYITILTVLYRSWIHFQNWFAITAYKKFRKV